LDYVLLSGDLAQVGTDADYEVFQELFLDKLMEVFKKGPRQPFVLTIPGNHDIQRQENELLKTFTEVVTTSKKDNKRSAYLTEHVPEFKKLFGGYTSFLNGIKSESYGASFDPGLLKTIKIHKEYAESGLFGFVVDHARQLIFVLLNSSWYSLGGSFNAIYAGQILTALEKIRSETHFFSRSRKGKYALSKNQIEEWLKLKDLLSDYSNQVSGIQLLKDVELENIFEKYPDYYVITTMHHPRNWMHYAESYSHNPADEESTAYLLNKLIKSSDMLLTGHEHVPVTTDAERLMEEILHLKAGCFLSDNQHKEANFDISWFSVLNINVSKREVDQRRYFWNTNEEKWNYFDKKFLPVNRDVLGRLIPERRKEILNMIRSKSRRHLATFLAAGQYGTTDIKNINWMKNESSQLLDWYTYQITGKGYLCLFARQEDVYNKLYSDPEFSMKLSTFLQANPRITHVKFLILDVLTDVFCWNIYDKTCDFFVILNQVARISENYFNVLRHKFFTDASSLGASTPALKKLSFMNEIIPFWIAEKFWFTG
jgi:3',5'-cyclic AMP phosphodiesterase CpdA